MGKQIVECRPLSGALPLSPTAVSRTRAGATALTRTPRGGSTPAHLTIASSPALFAAMPRGLQECCQRVLFRHPSIRRITKQLKTNRQTFEEQGIWLEERMNRILEISECPATSCSRCAPPGPSSPWCCRPPSGSWARCLTHEIGTPDPQLEPQITSLDTCNIKWSIIEIPIY